MAQLSLSSLAPVAIALAVTGCAASIIKTLPAERTSEPRLATSQALEPELSTGRLATGETVATREVEPGRPLTLADVVRETLASDPRIRAAREDVEEARGTLATAELLPNPVLDVGTSLQPLGGSFNAETRQGGPPQFDVGVAFPVDWLLFGKRSAAVAAAEAGTDVAGAKLADVIRLRLLAVVTAFYDALEAQAALDIEREDLDNMRSLQRITEERVQAGGAGTIESDRVRVAVLDREIEVRRSEADTIAATATLVAELGRPGAEAPVLLDGSLDVVHPVPPPSLADVLDLAEQHRPDLCAARLAVKQAERAVESEQRKAYPQVTSRLGYTRQFQEQAIGFPDVSAWGASVETTLPVFDRNQGGTITALAAERRAEADVRTTTAEVGGEVRRALARYGAAYTTATLGRRERLADARAVRDKIEAAYRLGGRSLIDVLDAQRALRDTLRLDLSERAAFWKSALELNSAVGKEVVP